MSMIEVARYFSYEEASDHQLELMDAGIESQIEMKYTGISFFGGNSSAFLLLVDEENADQAMEITGSLLEEGEE